MRKKAIHKLHKEWKTSGPVVLEMRQTRCGEFAYDRLSTKTDSEVTCKRCLKGLAKDKR